MSDTEQTQAGMRGCLLLGLLKTPMHLRAEDPRGGCRLWSVLGKKPWSTLAVTATP